MKNPYTPFYNRFQNILIPCIPACTCTHTLTYMHTPSLQGLLGYQQPPSLGGQGVHILPREDTGVWALPVCACTVPYNLQVHALESKCPMKENTQWGVGPRVLCVAPCSAPQLAGAQWLMAAFWEAAVPSLGSSCDATGRCLAA